MNETWDMLPYFKGSGYGNGKSYIVVETWEGPGLPFQDNGFLGFDFEDDTPVETMHEVIRLLNKHISRVTFTGLNKPEWAHVVGRGERARVAPNE